MSDEPKTTATEPKTVRARIALAVNSLGQWTACGGSHCEGDKAKEWLFLDEMESGEHYYWVEVAVPVPNNEIKGTLVAEVQDAES